MPKSEVYRMDCMEALRAMPDNAFDLAVADPPYGDALEHTHTHTHTQDVKNLTGGGYKPQMPRRGQMEPLFQGNSQQGITPSESGRNSAVTRTGGTWAAKYAKKS